MFCSLPAFASGLTSRDHVRRKLVAATMLIILAEAVIKDFLQSELLLGDKAAPGRSGRQHDVHDAADARRGRDLYRGPEPATHHFRVYLVDIVLFTEFAILHSRHRGIDNHDVLQRLRYGVFKDALERRAVPVELQPVHQQAHLLTVAGVTDRLVVHRIDAIAVGLAQRAETPGRIERFVKCPVDLDFLQSFERQYVDLLALDDALAGIAVLIDEPVRRPGQRILEHVVRMLGEGADPQLDGTQLVEVLDQLVRGDADKTGRQPALRDERGGRSLRERTHRIGDGDIFREVEIMQVLRPRDLRDSDVAIEGEAGDDRYRLVLANVVGQLLLVARVEREG